MKKIFLLIIFMHAILANAQNVGIGTTTPNANALLHIDLGSSATKGLLISGTYNNASTIPDLGAGSRMMYYPGKAAFRVGYVDGTKWDNANVGLYSIAMGHSTRASGSLSTAIGYSTTASEFASTAIGNNTIASGYTSTAMGGNTTASGSNSTAMGGYTTASGLYSTAMGRNTTASGEYSTAMGYSTTASGNYSSAMGLSTTASGHYSTTMGFGVSSNDQIGSFLIGDTDPNAEGYTYSGTPQQFVARFWNGYYLMTSGNSVRFGVQIGHNGNAWLTICDKNSKENFEPLNGEDVLQKISAINFNSWNYKKQDPKVYRHYGIMAQDFYSAFGRDKYGIIGNDTTVNPIDMIGIDMAAIKALEKRTTDQKADLVLLIQQYADIKNENEKLKQLVAQMQLQLNQPQKLIVQTQDQLKAMAFTQGTKEIVVKK